MIKKVCVLYFLVIFTSKVNAQEDSIWLKALDSLSLDDIFGKPIKHYPFKVSLNYSSNYIYGGRKDTSSTPYLSPCFEYTHKNGFYALITPAFLINQKFKLDFTSAQIGFTFDSLKKFSNSSIYLGRTFYSNKSTNVQSDINWIVGANFVYDVNPINVLLSPAVLFGSNTDFALNTCVNHNFYFANKKQTFSFTLIPTVSATFGNTGFVQQFNFRVRPRRQNEPPPIITATINSPKKFQLLSYDFSLPIFFDKEKWGIMFSPAFVFAQNPIQSSIKYTGQNGNTLPQQIVTNNGWPTSFTEQIENSFFIDLGAYFKF